MPGNNCSLINPDFQTTETTGMIGVYIRDDSRTIVMESGVNGNRKVTIYSVEIKSLWEHKTQLKEWSVREYEKDINDQTHRQLLIRELRSFRTSDYREFQVSNDDFNSFRTIITNLPKECPNEYDNVFDSIIQSELTKLNQSIEVPSLSLCQIL